MRLTVRAKGFEMVRQGLEDLGAEVPKIGRRRMRTVMNRVVRRMQEYPSERPGQKYTRTGLFFRRWMIKEIARVGYRIENTRPAGQYVVGDAYGTTQAWMHKGRWPLFRDVTDEELKELPKEFLDEIMIVARREGFDTP